MTPNSDFVNRAISQKYDGIILSTFLSNGDDAKFETSSTSHQPEIRWHYSLRA